MAATKTSSALASSQSVAANGSHTGTGVDLSTSYGTAAVDVEILNGGTGPTLPLVVTIETSNDGSIWGFFQVALVGGVANNGSYTAHGIVVPEGVQHVRTTATGNTGQAVSYSARVSRITAL
jgi:hypothetical protein